MILQPREPDGQVRRVCDLLAWAALAAVLVLVLCTFRDYGVSWDEDGQHAYGQLLVRYYASGLEDRSVFHFSNLYFYGGGFDLLAVLLAPALPFADYETRHLLGGLVGILGLAGVWRLGRRVGGPRAGLIALLLLACTPRFYGHMFINPKDAPLAAGVVWLLLIMVRVLDEAPKVRFRTSVGFGLILGLTLGTRIGGLITAAYLGVPLLVWLGRDIRDKGAAQALREGFSVFFHLIPALPVGYLVMCLIWPWAWQSLKNPILALTMFSHFPFGGSILFDGQITPAVDLPVAYLPTLLTLTTPEILLAGMVLAGVLAGAALWREPGRLVTAPWLQRLALGLAVVFPVVYVLATHPTLYNGIRHFLFVLPPACVAAALAFDRLLGPPRPPHAVPAIVLALGLALPVTAMIALHPYQYIYFNSLGGGVKGAEDRYELEYWGTSIAEAVRGLEEKIVAEEGVPSRPYRVYVCADRWSGTAFFPSWMHLAEEMDEADFLVGLNQFYCESTPGAARIVEVIRLGVPLAFVDDLRQTVER